MPEYRSASGSAAEDLFLLEKHEIAAFVLVDKSGYFYA